MVLYESRQTHGAILDRKMFKEYPRLAQVFFMWLYSTGIMKIMRSKAFFVNGGAGRVISSIPAFEKYAETNDDFIIVCEGGTDFYKGHPTLDGKAYDHWHKNLFQEQIKHRDCVSP